MLNGPNSNVTRFDLILTQVSFHGRFALAETRTRSVKRILTSLRTTNPAVVFDITFRVKCIFGTFRNSRFLTCQQGFF